MTSPGKRGRVAPPPAGVAAAAALPEDLVFSEVQARLPVKSLTRLKSVCRSWRAAIEDPNPALVRRHLDLSRRARPPSVLVIPREDHDYDLEEDAASEAIRFHRLRLAAGSAWSAAHAAEAAELMLEKAWPPEGVTHRIAPVHCDGLVALAMSSDHGVLVCNPATREFVALPPGSRDVQDDFLSPVALGFDRWRGRYLVARCFYRRYDCGPLDVAAGKYVLDFDIGHEVLALGGDGDSWSWELTGDPPHAIGSWTTPICTREAFYWHGHEDAPRHSMLRFGLRDGTFDVFPCPPGCCRGGATSMVVDMAELGGKLCCVYEATNKVSSFDVWVADDVPRPEWSLHCRVDTAVGCSPPDRYLIPVAAAGDDGMMLVAVNFGRLCLYDVQRRALVEVADLERAVQDGQRQVSKYTGDWCEIRHYVVPHVESLVPIAARK